MLRVRIERFLRKCIEVKDYVFSLRKERDHLMEFNQTLLTERNRLLQEIESLNNQREKKIK